MLRCLIRTRRTLLGAILRQPLGEILHLLPEPRRLFRQLRRLTRISRGGGGGTSAHGVGQRSVARGQFPGLIAERLHGPLVRRPLQHLRTALQLLTHPLLHLREVSHRVARLFAVHLLGCALQLLHLRLHLRRERLTQQRLGFAQLSRKRRVQRPGRFQLLLEVLRRLAKLLHAVGHRALLVRERASLLRTLEAHVAPRRGRRRRARAGAVLGAPHRTLARLRARRLGGALRERALRRGHRTRLLHRRIAQGSRTGAQFLGRRATYHELAAHAALTPRRPIRGLGSNAHGLARLERDCGDVEDGCSRPRWTSVSSDTLLGAGVGFTRDAHGDAREAVIVRSRDAQLESRTGGEHRVAPWLGEVHARHGVGDHDEIERWRQVRNVAPLRRGRPLQLHRAKCQQAPGKALPRREECVARVTRFRQRDRTERHGCATRNVQRRAARHSHRFARRQCFRRPPEIRRIGDAHGHGAHEWPVGSVHDHAVARRPAVRGDEAEIAPQRLQRPPGDASAVHAQRITSPWLSRLSRVEHDLRTARRMNRHP